MQRGDWGRPQNDHSCRILRPVTGPDVPFKGRALANGDFGTEACAYGGGIFWRPREPDSQAGLAAEVVSVKRPRPSLRKDKTPPPFTVNSRSPPSLIGLLESALLGLLRPRKSS